MIKIGNRIWRHPAVVELIKRDSTKRDPAEIIKERARQWVRKFYGSLIKGPPFNPNQLASSIGIHIKFKSPPFGDEAELVPKANRRLEIHCNPEKPLTRQNFSVCHEVAHTLLPNYEETIQCRRAKGKHRFDPHNEVEYLCDLAAAELLLPSPWFDNDVREYGFSTESILRLSERYKASKEAVTIRIVQISSVACAAIFLSWKYKPSQEKEIERNKHQGYLFPMTVHVPQKTLRVDFAVPSRSFQCFIPRSKSVKEDSIMYKTAIDGISRNGIEDVDWGNVRKMFYIEALALKRRLLQEQGPWPVIALLTEHPKNGRAYQVQTFPIN